MSTLLLALFLSVPIEEVARDFGAIEPVDWCAVLTKASLDSRYTFDEIVLRDALYTCRSPMVLGRVGGRPIALRGTGPADWSSYLERGSILFWARTSSVPAVTVLAGGTRIEGIKFQSQGAKLAAPGFPSALKIFARTQLRDVAVFNWRVSDAAIHIHGNGKAMGTDASLMRFDGVKINGVWGDGYGFMIHGADANAGKFSQLSIVNVQNNTSIKDSSQLGNFYDACHIHPSERSERSGGVNRSPPVIADGRGARSVFLACYAESGTLPSIIVPPNMWIGGFAPGVSGGGLVLATGELRNVRLRQPTIVSARMNTAGVTPMARFEVDGSETPEWWSIEYDGRSTSPHKGWLRTLYRASSSAEVEAWKGGVWR